MSLVLEVFFDGEWLPLLPGEGQAPIVNRDYAAVIEGASWQSLGRALLTHSRHGELVLVPKYHACRTVEVA